MALNSLHAFMSGERLNSIKLISNDKTIFNNIKSNRICSRPAFSVFFDFDENYVAPVYACLPNEPKIGEAIVFTATLTVEKTIFGSTIHKIAYAVVSKKGIYHYNEKSIREALQRSIYPKGGIKFLIDWRTKQAEARNSIENLLSGLQEDELC